MTLEKPLIDPPAGAPPADLEITDLTAAGGTQAQPGHTVTVQYGRAARALASLGSDPRPSAPVPDVGGRMRVRALLCAGFLTLAAGLATAAPASAVANGSDVPAGKFGFAAKLTMTNIPKPDGTKYN